jgi:NADH:ubiquinone oxidoreductase subunit K
MRDNLIRRLFNVLNKDKILYCNWKSTDHLSASFCGDTDFDVLACRYHRAGLESVLNEIGFVEFNTTALRRYPGVVDYIGYCGDLKKMVHLHLHYQLVLGDRWVKAFRIPIESKILNRRTWSGDFNTWIISPEDELLMFLARMPLKLKHPLVLSTLLFIIGHCLVGHKEERFMFSIFSIIPIIIGLNDTAFNFLDADNKWRKLVKPVFVFSLVLNFILLILFTFTPYSQSIHFIDKMSNKFKGKQARVYCYV